MRLKKRSHVEPEPADFWPVPGLDGLPYPPEVQEALDLVEAETKRIRRAECTHKSRYPTTRYALYESFHVCACRYCGSDRIPCLPDRADCDPDVMAERRAAARRERERKARAMMHLPIMLDIDAAKEVRRRSSPYLQGDPLRDSIVVRRDTGDYVVRVDGRDDTAITWLRTD